MIGSGRKISSLQELPEFIQQGPAGRCIDSALSRHNRAMGTAIKSWRSQIIIVHILKGLALRQSSRFSPNPSVLNRFKNQTVNTDQLRWKR